MEEFREEPGTAAATALDDTPMMKQYREWKRRYPDYLLLFRLGDFYEAFYGTPRWRPGRSTSR
jgi:hypothetical protein